MLERKLRIYFGYFPLSWLLVILISLLLFLLTWWLTPGGNLSEEAHSKVFSIFVRLLGMEQRRLEVALNIGIMLCGRLLPVVVIVLGGLVLRQFWQDKPASEIEADPLIGQALANLPRRAAALMGLPSDLQQYETLILWGPRPEDFATCQSLLPPHERQYSVVGCFRAGKDRLGRYARYDVLVLLRDDVHLYLLDGFYDITKGQFTGERTGDYWLSDVAEHLHDKPTSTPDKAALPHYPLHTRVGLRFKDGWQYEVNLLGEREGQRIFSPPEAPLITHGQAIERLKVFCPEQPKEGAAVLLPAPAEHPQLPAGAAQVETRAPNQTPRRSMIARFSGAIPFLGRRAVDSELAELERNLLSKTRGDQNQAERLVEFERSNRPGHTRAFYLRAAIERWERDNR